jgi:hypothetical protein
MLVAPRQRPQQRQPADALMSAGQRPQRGLDSGHAGGTPAAPATAAASGRADVSGRASAAGADCGRAGGTPAALATEVTTASGRTDLSGGKSGQGLDSKSVAVGQTASGRGACGSSAGGIVAASRYAP